MSMDAVAVQPFASVTVTVNVPTVETTIELVVPPFDHVYCAKPGGAVSVILSPTFARIVVGAVMVAVGFVLTVSACVAVLVHCALLLTSVMEPLPTVVQVTSTVLPLEAVGVPPTIVH